VYYNCWILFIRVVNGDPFSRVYAVGFRLKTDWAGKVNKKKLNFKISKRRAVKTPHMRG